jgi:uncharacterized protein (TIGR00251 family)
MSADLSALEILERAGGVELTVKVVPGASRSRVLGTWGKALRLALTAPPQAGEANAALVRLLASTFGVKRAAVQIVTGQAQPVKRVRILGPTVEQARASLAQALAQNGGAQAPS